VVVTARVSHSTATTVVGPFRPGRAAFRTYRRLGRTRLTHRVVRLLHRLTKALVTILRRLQHFVLFVLDLPFQYVLAPGAHPMDLYGVQTFRPHVRVVQVVFEREPILVFLRPIAGHVPFLAAHVTTACRKLSE